jgi:hypothetical protein
MRAEHGAASLRDPRLAPVWASNFASFQANLETLELSRESTVVAMITPEPALLLDRSERMVSLPVDGAYVPQENPDGRLVTSCCHLLGE